MPSRWYRPLLALLILVSPAHAQSFGKWYALGPFDHPRGADNIDQEFAPERNLGRIAAGASGPDLSASYPAKGSERATWQELATTLEGFDVGPIHFATALQPPAKSSPGWSDNAVVYLYRQIDCSADQQLKVRCGSDDGLRLWLNGQLLVDFAGPRALNPSSHTLEFALKAGANHLFAKVANGGGGWSFQLGPQPTGAVDQAAINRAIDRGMAHLQQIQLLDGSWAEHPEYQAGATGYAAYCLLKCGLAPDQPALERARAYVLEHASGYTYSTATELLFLCELGRPDDVEAIAERTEALLDFQFDTGLFGYPTHPAGHSHDDLSLTLYAALALHAAERNGQKVPPAVWERMLQGTLTNFEGIQATEVARGEGAGFRYRLDHAVTGSMTTAGLSVLSLARTALGGDVPQRHRRQFELAMSAGLRWLVGRMNWSENPGAGAGHHYFWLYGVERVGGLFGLSELGGVDWYAQGAAFLTGAQHGNGSWGTTVDSILALLFLKRASAPSSGKKEDAGDHWTTLEEEAPFRLTARGGRKLSVWVKALNADTRARLEWPSRLGGGLHVARMEYHATAVASGAVALVGVLERDRTQRSEENELAVQGELPARGEWDIVARLLAILPPDENGNSSEEWLLSPPLRVVQRDVLRPEQLRYAREGIENLLAGQKIELECSSTEGDQAVARAFDGLQSTSWRASAQDKAPWLRIRWPRAAKVRRLAFSHADPRLEGAAAARPSKLRVLLDEKEQYEFTLESDPLSKSYLEFAGERRPKRIEIQILELSHGQLGTAAVGFAEIELLADPGKRSK